MFSYLLTFQDKHITTSEDKSLQRREAVISGNRNCFYRAVTPAIAEG